MTGLRNCAEGLACGLVVIIAATVIADRVHADRHTALVIGWMAAIAYFLMAYLLRWNRT